MQNSPKFLVVLCCILYILCLATMTSLSIAAACIEPYSSSSAGHLLPRNEYWTPSKSGMLQSACLQRDLSICIII